MDYQLCPYCGIKFYVSYATSVQAPQSTQEKIYCDECGTKIKNNAKFCEECGHKL
jgi:hypothetical protein